MAPDKGTDPGQERPEPRDAPDRWARKSGGGGDDAEDKDGEEKDGRGKGRNPFSPIPGSNMAASRC